ncbi:MAG: hypothetical protein ACJATT_002848 [Myxococcota bacterium]
MTLNLVWLLATVASVSSAQTPDVQWDGAVGGTVRDRIGDVSAAEVILLVSGEQRGYLGDCGCPSRPLGGIARVDAYAQAVRRKTGVPVLRVNAGHAFDDTIGITGTLRDDVVATNALMAEALSSWEMVNYGVSDIPWLDGHPLRSAVSATQTPTDGRPSHVLRTVEVDGETVALVGLSGAGLAFLPPEHHAEVEVIAGLEMALAQTDAQTVVVVGVDLGDALLRVAAHPRVGLLVTAERVQERWAPELLGETVWVRSIDDGQVLTDIRLTVDGGLRSVVVRSIDLDSRLPEVRETRRLADREAEIRARGLP